MSAPKTLRVFLKGNVDVRDSLLWSRVNGKVEWNGIGQGLRQRGVLARMRHETAAGFDFIPLPGQTTKVVPPEVAEWFPAGHPSPLLQHSTALFAGPSDVVVLSLQPDVMNRLVLHRGSGLRFLAEDMRTWEPQRREWLRRECELASLCTVEDSMSALERLLRAIGDTHGASVLIYNLCPVLPGERIHSYLGAADALALRVQRFNLALAELSAQRDFSIVDVQRISAWAGAERVKLDLVHFNALGWQLIAEEVLRILEVRGLLDGGLA